MTFAITEIFVEYYSPVDIFRVKRWSQFISFLRTELLPTFTRICFCRWIIWTSSTSEPKTSSKQFHLFRCSLIKKKYLNMTICGNWFGYYLRVGACFKYETIYEHTSRYSLAVDAKRGEYLHAFDGVRRNINYDIWWHFCSLLMNARGGQHSRRWQSW